VLIWLSVCSEVQIVCISPSWCHCIQKPHHQLLPHLNPHWFYLSGTSLSRLSWKRGYYTGVVVIVVIIYNQCSLVNYCHAIDLHSNDYGCLQVLLMLWYINYCQFPVHQCRHDRYGLYTKKNCKTDATILTFKRLFWYSYRGMCTECRRMDCQSNVISDGIRREVRVRINYGK